MLPFAVETGQVYAVETLHLLPPPSSPAAGMGRKPRAAVGEEG